MSADISESKRKAIDEVHRRIGRNLLRFQEMEVALKLVLPYVHPDAGAKGLEAMREYQRKHVDLKTLGSLFEQFEQAADLPPEFFDYSSEAITAARNDLVHHFYKLPRVDLLKQDGLDQASAWLDDQFEKTHEWYRFLRTQSLVSLIAFMESNPSAASEFGRAHEKLLALLPPGVEYINKRDPTRTSWATTRIVRLLKLAELNTEKLQNLTLLSRAGQFIKENAPDISPREYGIRTLEDVLHASGMFEVYVGTDGSTIVYRSIEDVPTDLKLDDPCAMSFSIMRGS